MQLANEWLTGSGRIIPIYRDYSTYPEYTEVTWVDFNRKVILMTLQDERLKI